MKCCSLAVFFEVLDAGESFIVVLVQRAWQVPQSILDVRCPNCFIQLFNLKPRKLESSSQLAFVPIK